MHQLNSRVIYFQECTYFDRSFDHFEDSSMYSKIHGYCLWHGLIGTIVGTTVLIFPTLNLLAQGSPPEFKYENYDFWVNQCLTLTAEQQYSEALTACEKAITLKPKQKNTPLWVARAQVLFQLGRYAESLVSADQVIAAAPKNSAAICSAVCSSVSASAVCDSSRALRISNCRLTVTGGQVRPVLPGTITD